jgi:hypothetical protein
VEWTPPRHRPGRDIAIALVAKTVALALLYALLFGPAHRIAVDAASIEARLTAVAETAPADQVKR